MHEQKPKCFFVIVILVEDLCGQIQRRKFKPCDSTGSCDAKNNIHIENNCGGNMIFTHEDTEYLFNDRPFCNYNDKEITYSNFKCSKCDYLYRKFKSSIGGGSQYIPKGGFWWK